MAATLMDGKALAQQIRARVAEDVAALGGVGLTTVLIGDDPASDIYIRLKHNAAVEAGIEAVDLRLPEETREDELLEKLDELNADDRVHAVLVQLPLPAGIDEARVLSAVDPAKDVDGFHPVNAGQLLQGHPHLVPATARGVLALLREYDVELAGADAVVVGRSEIVGKPTAQLLEQANATVTICHSRTRDLAAHTRAADVLVVATGRPSIVSADMVKPGAAVIDVGINSTDDGIVGDVEREAADVARYLTPVPGGVGPMTIACLLENTVICARTQSR